MDAVERLHAVTSPVLAFITTLSHSDSLPARVSVCLCVGLSVRSFVCLFLCLGRCLLKAGFSWSEIWARLNLWVFRWETVKAKMQV